MWFEKFILLLLLGLIAAFDHDPFSGPNIAANQTTVQYPDCHGITTACSPQLAVDEQNSTCFQGVNLNGSSWTVSFKRSYYIAGIRIIYLKLGLNTGDDSLLSVSTTAGPHDVKPIFQAKLQKGILHNILEIKFNDSFHVTGLTLYSATSALYFCEVQVFSEYCVAIPFLSYGSVVIYNNSGENFHRYGDYYQNTAGTIIQLSCEAGYILTGHSLIKCLPSGIYNTSIPKCARAVCPVVNATNNGRITVVENTGITNWTLWKNTVGTILNFSCNEGYFHISGPTFVQCEEGGGYNDTTKFTCSEYVCPVVSTLHNGQVLIVENTGRTDGQRNTVGIVLQFSCNHGFHVSGPQFIRCLDSGSYNDSTNITCLETSCPAVSTLANGNVTTMGIPGRSDGQYSVGTVLHFSCNKGFRLVGPEAIQCLETGSYNSSIGTMCLELPRCPPFTIYNGKVIYSDGLYKGSTARITCEKGYKIDRQTTLTCSDNQTWTGALSTCTLINCQIPILHNGKYILKDSTPLCQQNSTLGIPYQCHIYPECDEGYELLNNQTRQCEDSETWNFNRNEPVCQKMCSVSLHSHGNYWYMNGSIVNTTYIQNGTEIILKCKDGYRTVGLSHITCQSESAVWLGDIANCTEIVCYYTQNETATNGVYIRKSEDYFTSGILTINETVNLKCKKGYEYYSGSLSRTCQTDGTLSGAAAICKRVTCPPLPLVNGVSYQYSDENYTSVYPYNTTVDVSCDRGILQEGTQIRRCLENGSWHGLSPTCIPTCSLPLVQYGYLSKGTEMVQPNETTFTNGTRLVLTCNDGYEFNVFELTCLETRNWSDKPLCYVVLCLRPPDILHGLYDNVSDEYEYGSVLTVTCYEGYYLSSGNFSRQCQADKSWDGYSPVCSAIVAGQTSKKTAVIGGAVGSVLLIIAVAVTLIVLKHRGILTIFGKKAMQRRPLDRRTTKTDGAECDRTYTEIQDIELRDKSEDAPVTSRQLQPNIGVWSNYEVEQPKNAYYKFGSVVAETIPKTAILIKDLSDLVFTGKDFQTEFEKFPVGLHGEHSVALKSQNKGKSRYKNLYAYDESRVILETDTSESDYINACYVHGFQRERAYIASQGPVTEIFIDFWRMIWQTNCKKIVMLTKLVELAKTKCDQYWPEEGTKVYGNVSVSKKGVDIFSEFVIRTFIVQKENLPDRTVTQFHFTAWPDKGVPRHASSLVHFRNKVKYTGCSDVAPIVVHCSAGVGRTGTFIALDYLTDQAKCLGYVDVYGCVENLRKQRVNLVQTVEQYMFIHHALVETLMLSTSALPSAKFPEAYQKLLEKDANTEERKLDHDFKMLKRLSPVTKEEQYVSAKLVRNRKKNRYLNILPVDEFMPRLSAGTEEYVNAVFLPSYKEKKAFIITQTPLETTIESFWKLAWEHNVHTIVMMNNLEEMQVREIYWPKEGDNISFAEFQVLNEGATLEDQHNVLSMRLQSQSERREISLIQCGGWPSSANLPHSPKILLSLLEIVQSWQQQTENQPILVHCMNGAEKSGLYCVVSAVIERMKIEQDVAISQVIQEMRNAREQLISSVDQYQFCHEVVLAYIQQNETYSNFSL